MKREEGLILNHLLVIIIGLLAIFMGVVLADREFIDDIRDARIAALEEKLQGKLLPSINISGRATVWAGGGEVVVQEEGKGE